MNPKKWTEEEIINEARRRLSAMTARTRAATEQMLQSLVREAGWSDQSLVDALCADIIRRHTARPHPKKSGTMVKVTMPEQKGANRAANSGRK